MRKHVKNHAIKDEAGGRKKQRKEVTNLQSQKTKKSLESQLQSPVDISISSSNGEIRNNATTMNAMNHMFEFDFELSDIKCSPSNENDLNFVSNDEMVSIESIKKYLGEKNVEFIDYTLQNHISTEYFNEFN